MTWLATHRANRSLRWLRTHWLTAWAAIPGAHLEPSPETLRGARQSANLVLSECPVWIHHRDRIIKVRGRTPELDVMWGVAMRCARGAAHFAMCQGENPVAPLVETRNAIKAQAGRLDTPEDPFKDALS